MRWKTTPFRLRRGTCFFVVRPLTAREKSALGAYIPQVDLDNAVLHDGHVPWYLWSDFAGITRGNRIYFRPGVYDSRSVAGIALLGHELVHVGQYRNGMTALSYLLSARYGYMKSPYEEEAYAIQAKITQDCADGEERALRMPAPVRHAEGPRSMASMPEG